MESVSSQESVTESMGASPHAKPVTTVMQERTNRRMSKFKEELGDEREGGFRVCESIACI